MEQHLFKHFQTTERTDFVEDVSITVMDKTDTFIPAKREVIGDKH